MVTIKQLFFEPNNFSKYPIDPITFEKGVNLIIGEKSDNIHDGIEGKKMNGVGKSMLVEAINFCLLKDIKNSRIDRIPIVDLSADVYICLTLEIETESSIRLITVKRTRDNNKPVIVVDGDREVTHDKLKDAESHLESLFFRGPAENVPSLRSMLSILLREEKTSYSDILHPYGKSGVFNFSDLIKPHLYLFHFDLSLIEELKKVFSNIDKAEKVATAIRADFKNSDVDPAEVKAYLNDLEDRVNKLNLAVDNLRPSEASKQKHDDLNKILLELEKLNDLKAAKDYAVEKIKRLPQPEDIPLDSIRITYNKYKEGLGDLVQKSFEQVLAFKEQIEEFQNKLMTEKLKDLQAEVLSIQEKIDILDEQASKIYAETDAKSKIGDLTEAVKLQREKGEKYERLKANYEMLEAKDALKKKLRKEKNELLDKIDILKFELSRELREFETDLIELHDYIEGNKICQFDIKTNESRKEYLEFDYRITHDGSSGINRIKTFMYDVLLMLNRFTAQKHLGFLIHDNIFASAGRDDMVRALNYLVEQEARGKKFQYIVTINKDEFESQIKEFKFDYTKKTRKEMTREHPFLETVYSEQV